LLPQSRDGTSQRARRLAALDPAYARIDERTSVDVLGFVQAYAEQLRFFERNAATGELIAGTWADFSQREGISIADVAAYVADPTRFTGERARWLGRPHFALLLAFVELLGHARDHLNGFTRRHLDYYYRDLLQMQAEPPNPDRATVILGLRPSATELQLPAGTELQAGRDAGGVPRIYRTEREIVVNRAVVAQARSVFVDRRITGISDARADRSLTAADALTETLKIALGRPRSGDPIPLWSPGPPSPPAPVDVAFLKSLRGVLDFAGKASATGGRPGPMLYLEHQELRSLMQLFRRRRDADPEWIEINRLLGIPNPTASRDFPANLKARVGVLDFANDTLPLVNSVDDLYTYRTEPAVRVYIDGPTNPAGTGGRLAVIGFDNFVKLMQIKLRIDAEWAEINRLLERIGRRQRGVLEWALPAGDPTNFAGNLAAALQGKWPPPWPPASPPQTKPIEDYDALLRRLEVHLSMPVERIETLVAFAELIGPDARSEDFDWSEIDRILADAHREMVRAARQAQLAMRRARGQDVAAFDAEASFVLGEPAPINWDDARPLLAAHLGRSQLDLLTGFRAALGAGPPMFGFGWADADRLFELAWRHVEARPDPVAQKIEVHNVYAYDDATLAKDDATASGWKTFGRAPLVSDDKHPLGAMLGWSLRSPLLALSEGQRTLTLTLGLRGDEFHKPEQADFLGALGRFADARPGDTLASQLNAAITVEVSTAKGWIVPDLKAAQLASGDPNDDYWSLLHVNRAAQENRPALQLQMVIDVSRDPIAPRKEEDQIWPTLRLSLRPRWKAHAKEWQMLVAAFAPLVLVAVHLKVEVTGLAALRLQQDDRLLDPRKPFEPFGSRPAVGARLYIDHPELVRARLDRLRFDIEWMGLPDSLKDQYLNYPGVTDSSVFKTHVALVDRNVELGLGDLSLFADEPGTTKTKATSSLAIDNVPVAIQTSAPGFAYVSRSDLAPGNDVRLASRYLRWELTPRDFGHAISAALAATKSRELAVAIANAEVKTDATHTTASVAAAYRVDPPYTPTIKRLSVFYAASVELDPTSPAIDHQLLHVHPFGVCPIDATLPSLLPRYEDAGELYIGVRDLRPPQHLTLLLQLAEGTSDPDLEPAPVTWSYLAADGFADLSGTGIVDEATRGLINSGIVELSLPAAASDGRLPRDLYWLRIAIPRDPTSVCDVVAIRAQAVSVRFDDRGNSPAHYAQPLPVGSIGRLVEHDARTSTIEQPYSSSGGRPAEQPEWFDTRVSERLRHKNRALSAWDYERLVLHRFRQIYKAKCLASAGRVDVLVIPDIRALHPGDPFAPKAPANLLADIQAYLAERAPAAALIRVRNAKYVPVQVRLGVRFHKGLDEGFAQRRLNEALVRFLSPWAFDDGAELMIGGKIYANSILDFADRRDDVDFVAEIKLFRCVNGKDFDLIPPVVGDYHVAADGPDQVLVAAPQHYFDVIPEAGFQQASFSGINYARIELDFIVA
jgi:hypothetical protein